MLNAGDISTLFGHSVSSAILITLVRDLNYSLFIPRSYLMLPPSIGVSSGFERTGKSWVKLGPKSVIAVA